MSDLFIGIDLGGTHLRGALVDSKGNILKSQKKAVGMLRTESEMIGQLAELIESFRQFSSIKGIGVGVPGIVSGEAGIVYASPHFPAWSNFEIKVRLEEKIKQEVCIDNDANLIARGESWKGAATEWNHFLMVTLGTGVGGAIVINGRPFSGEHGFTGEFGHMVIQVDGPQCGCGSRGCLETYVSASALIRMAQLMAVDADWPGSKSIDDILKSETADIVKELAGEAKTGNVAAKALFEQMGYYLAIGLASLVNVTGITKILLGGGVSAAQDLFMPAVMQELPQRTYKKTMELLEVKFQALGDDAGALGAAHLACEKAALIS